ncbi:hypothetical protein HT031_001848 [Scenedesmus sp. PABB004]|nr:hypothetical protein HT031_001848 [Scenedesmus sp. PABB004]
MAGAPGEAPARVSTADFDRALGPACCVALLPSGAAPAAGQQRRLRGALEHLLRRGAHRGRPSERPGAPPAPPPPPPPGAPTGGSGAPGAPSGEAAARGASPSGLTTTAYDPWSSDSDSDSPDTGASSASSASSSIALPAAAAQAPGRRAGSRASSEAALPLLEPGAALSADACPGAGPGAGAASPGPAAAAASSVGDARQQQRLIGLLRRLELSPARPPAGAAPAPPRGVPALPPPRASPAGAGAERRGGLPSRAPSAHSLSRWDRSFLPGGGPPAGPGARGRRRHGSRRGGPRSAGGSDSGSDGAASDAFTDCVWPDASAVPRGRPPPLPRSARLGVGAQPACGGAAGPPAPPAAASAAWGSGLLWPVPEDCAVAESPRPSSGDLVGLLLSSVVVAPPGGSGRAGLSAGGTSTLAAAATAAAPRLPCGNATWAGEGPAGAARSGAGATAGGVSTLTAAGSSASSELGSQASGEQAPRPPAAGSDVAGRGGRDQAQPWGAEAAQAKLARLLTSTSTLQSLPTGGSPGGVSAGGAAASAASGAWARSPLLCLALNPLFEPADGWASGRRSTQQRAEGASPSSELGGGRPLGSLVETGADGAPSPELLGAMLGALQELNATLLAAGSLDGAALGQLQSLLASRTFVELNAQVAALAERAPELGWHAGGPLPPPLSPSLTSPPRQHGGDAAPARADGAGAPGDWLASDDCLLASPVASAAVRASLTGLAAGPLASKHAAPGASHRLVSSFGDARRPAAMGERGEAQRSGGVTLASLRERVRRQLEVGAPAPGAVAERRSERAVSGTASPPSAPSAGAPSSCGATPEPLCDGDEPDSLAALSLGDLRELLGRVARDSLRRLQAQAEARAPRGERREAAGPGAPPPPPRGSPAGTSPSGSAADGAGTPQPRAPLRQQPQAPPLGAPGWEGDSPRVLAPGGSRRPGRRGAVPQHEPRAAAAPPGAAGASSDGAALARLLRLELAAVLRAARGAARRSRSLPDELVRLAAAAAGGAARLQASR